MTSSPEVVSAQPGHRAPREGALLRGASAARAVSYREAMAAAPAPAPAPAAAPAPAPPRVEQPPTGPSPLDRRGTIRRAADQPVPANRPSFRLGDVYAEELARLRQQAHAEGYAAGHAEGMTAAASVGAEVEAAAATRLTEVQARWERRLVSATAALGAAVARLDERAVPVAEEVRDSVLDAVVTLVEDLLGRELALSDSPGLDAVRRALTLCP